MVMKEYVRNLAERIRNRKVAIFCGAGISFNSGIPCARPFLQKVLREIGLSDQKIEQVISSELPFELIMQTISSLPGFEYLLEAFDVVNPSKTHQFIALLLRENIVNTVVTTNFDRNIEVALQRLDYNFLDKSKIAITDGDLDSMLITVSETQIIKIHGCVSQRESMAINLKQVAGTQYTESRKKMINNLLKNSDVESIIVLGYSCSDIFDVCAFINEIDDSDCTIEFVDHQVNEHYSKSDLNYPFQGYKGVSVKINCDSLIDGLWSSMFPDMQYQSPSQGFEFYDSCVQRFSDKSKINRAELYFIEAQLMTLISDYQSAISAIDEAIALSEHDPLKPVYIEARANYLGELGMNLEAIEELDCILSNPEMISYLPEAFLQRVKSIHTYRSAMLGRPTTLRDYHLALNWSNKQLDMNSVAFLNGQIAFFHGIRCNYFDAMDFHKKVIQICTTSGDVKSLYQTYSNIANLQYNACKGEAATANFIKAIELCLSLDDRKALAILYSDIANMYVVYFFFDIAYIFSTMAVVIANEIGAINYQERIYMQYEKLSGIQKYGRMEKREVELAVIKELESVNEKRSSTLMAHSNEAIRLLESSAQLFRKGDASPEGNRLIKAEQYVFLGNEELAKGKYLQANAYYEKAIKMDMEFMPAFLYMSTAQRFLGDDRRSRYYIDKAISISDDVPVSRYNRGIMHMEEFEVEENPSARKAILTKAIDDFEMTIYLDPSYHRAYLKLIRLLIDSNQLEAASDCCKDCLNLTYLSIDLQLLHAETDLALGDIDIALDKLNELIENKPVPKAFFLRSKVHNLLGNDDQAIRDILDAGFEDADI